MKTALQAFIDALESVKKKEYLSRTMITNMTKPLFKQVTIELHRYENNHPILLFEESKIFKISTKEEKEAAILEVSQKIMQKVLEEYETI